MSSGPASEVDAFKRSVQGGFRNHMKNQMHFYHLLGLYFHFRWALHEKSQYFNFGPFPTSSIKTVVVGDGAKMTIFTHFLAFFRGY